MDEKNRQLLDQYIGRLLKLKEAKKQRFSAADLQEIALEVGITEADLALARQEVEDHMQRGAAYADAGDWAAATAQYRQATELDPLGLQTQHQLAHFYFRRWDRTKKGKKELDAALDQCLQSDPDHAPSRDLLLKVQKMHRRRRLWRGFKWAVCIVLAPFVLLAGAIFLKEAGFITPSPSGFEGLTYDVPVEIQAIEAGEGIDLTLDRLRILHDESVHRQGLFDYEYAGGIASDRYEVQKLRYTVAFLDAAGRQVASSYLWLFNADSGFSGDEDNFTLHPGDQFLFAGRDVTHFDTADPIRIAKARLSATRIERVRPPAAYPKYPSKPLEWRSQQVPYLAFELRQRESAYYDDEYARPRHYLQLEITHRGTQPCRELVIGIEWLDADGAVVRRDEDAVVSLDHRPVGPGTKLIYNRQEYFDEEDFAAEGRPFADYNVYIKTAD